MTDQVYGRLVMETSIVTLTLNTSGKGTESTDDGSGDYSGNSWTGRHADH